MNTSILNFFIVSSPKTKFSDEQVLLREFTGKDFSRKEAESLWANIENHKWNISKQLRRDVGFRVAAIDFIENFYQPRKLNKKTENSAVYEIKTPIFIRKAIRFYFEMKSRTMQF